MKRRIFLVCLFHFFLDCRSTKQLRLFSGNLPAMFLSSILLFNINNFYVINCSQTKALRAFQLTSFQVRDSQNLFWRLILMVRRAVLRDWPPAHFPPHPHGATPPPPTAALTYASSVRLKLASLNRA